MVSVSALTRCSPRGVSVRTVAPHRASRAARSASIRRCRTGGLRPGDLFRKHRCAQGDDRIRRRAREDCDRPRARSSSAAGCRGGSDRTRPRHVPHPRGRSRSVTIFVAVRLQCRLEQLDGSSGLLNEENAQVASGACLGGSPRPVARPPAQPGLEAGSVDRLREVIVGAERHGRRGFPLRQSRRSPGYRPGRDRFEASEELLASASGSRRSRTTPRADRVRAHLRCQPSAHDLARRSTEAATAR